MQTTRRPSAARSGRRALALTMTLFGCGDDVALPKDLHRAAEAGVDAAAQDADSIPIDRGHLTSTGSAPLDYADPALWLCRPGNDPNECHRGLDAIEFLRDGSQRTEQHVVADEPTFDCFYVYPTVEVGAGGNKTDLAAIEYVRDALIGQAARFSRICEVYAPLYRQRTFDATGTLTGDEALAQSDVEAAFRYYLTHFNRGRNYAIIGHSQGSGLLTRVVADEIDSNEARRARLVSALLIGATVAVPEDRVVGGTFRHLPLCTSPGQTRCVVAFASFAKEMPPSPEAATGLGRDPTGMRNACTNPSLLAGNSGRYRGSYIPATATHPLFVPNLPASEQPPVATLTVLVRDMFRGECVHRAGLGYLEIWPDPAEDDQRPVPAYRYSVIEQIGAGMHTGDFSVVMDDLIDAVALQARAMR